MASLSLRATLGALFVATAVLAQSTSDRPDPKDGEVPLPAAAGWHARLILDSDCGVWTLAAHDVMPRYGAPEVIGLDDLGRAVVLVSYSGKWTPNRAVFDGKWLGGLAFADVDPAKPERELYVAGQSGAIYQLRCHAEGSIDSVRIGLLRGREVHTLVGGDLLPDAPGDELIAFTRPAGAYRLTPPTARGEAWGITELPTPPGRIRNALLLPAAQGERPWIAALGRAGQVALYRLRPDGGIDSEVVLDEPMGFGRIARRETAAGAPFVIYATRDDGVILRLEGRPGERWRREVIFAGPQGPRGVVSGRFHADPDVETVAVFGYSGRVQLLTRGAGGWAAKTIFTADDRGHTLAVCEIDGRNATDEIVGSGFGRQVFLLSLPPGYGLDGVATDDVQPFPLDDEDRGKPERDAAPDDGEASGDTDAHADEAAHRPVRIAIRAGDDAAEELSPLRYQGGFEAKALIYETLVRRDADGRIVPHLAESFDLADDRRTWTFRLRDGATFHDGSPVTADAVLLHFRRWVGLPEHAWLGAAERIAGLRAVDASTLEIVTDRPYALLPDLCAINPASIRAPAALDRQGRFVGPVGSGAWKLVGKPEGGRVLRLERADGTPGTVDLVRFGDGPADELVDAVLEGDVDAVVGGWMQRIPRGRIAALRADPRVAVDVAPGSSVVYLSFRLAGPTADLGLRRRIAAAIDREALVATAEAGLASPCSTWAAPTVADWPAARPNAAAVAPAAVTATVATTADDRLVLLVDGDEPVQTRAAPGIAAQLRGRGIPVTVRTATDRELFAAVRAGQYDLRLEVTWGVPYDPDLSFVARFGAPPERPSAADDRYFGVDPELERLAAELGTATEAAGRRAVHAAAQRRIDDHVSVVPLFVPHRVVLRRADLPPLLLDHDLYRFDPRSTAQARPAIDLPKSH